MNAIQLTRLGARTEPPLSEGVVLAQVAAIGVEVSVLEPHQVKVVEVAVARSEVHGHRRHLRVAGRASVVALLGSQLADDDELDIGGSGLVSGEVAE